MNFNRQIKRRKEVQAELLALGLRLQPRNDPQATIVAGIIGDHISDAIRAHDRYERVFLDFIRDRLFEPEEAQQLIALDVGANIGNHSLFLAGLFKRVIAFEPNPITRSLLQLNVEMNGIGNVEIRGVGLSDKAGKATLAFDYGNLGAATATELDGQRKHQSVIELVIGDDAVPQLDPVGFIKVDIEGAEEAALAGLRNTIGRHLPIVMLEQWEGSIDGSTGTSPTMTFLQSLGYSAWELKPRPMFRGQVGKFTSLLLGRTEYRLEPVLRLSKRDYRALFFLPPPRSRTECAMTKPEMTKNRSTPKLPNSTHGRRYAGE